MSASAGPSGTVISNMTEFRSATVEALMARTVQVQLLDDIDGSQADETLSFALDGTNYEIDLNAKHAEKLRGSLAKFVSNSRRIGRGHIASTRRGRTGGTPARTDRAQNQSIRY